MTNPADAKLQRRLAAILAADLLAGGAVAFALGHGIFRTS